MLIQIDIDNTLYDSNKLFSDIAKDFDVDWPREYHHWLSPEDMGTNLQTLKNIFKRAHSREYVLQNTPYKGAVETLRGIAHDFDDVELAYISDRNEQQGAALKEWLEQEGFLTDANEHVAATADKRVWMREMKPDIVIEDRVRTILTARYELNASVVAVQHTYNMNLIGEAEGIHIVPTWRDINILLRELVIPQVQMKKLTKV